MEIFLLLVSMAMLPVLVIFILWLMGFVGFTNAQEEFNKDAMERYKKYGRFHPDDWWKQ